MPPTGAHDEFRGRTGRRTGPGYSRSHSHRDDDPQHGSAAPEHPRRPPRAARARGRDGARLPPRYRLSPHRLRKEHGGEDLQQGAPHDRPHGLPRAHVEQPGFRPRGRAASRPGNHAAVQLSARAPGRVDADPEPPRLAGDPRPRPRGDDGVPLLLQGARGPPQDFREGRWGADDDELLPRRGRLPRALPRVPCRLPEISGRISRQDGRLRGTPHGQSDFQGPQRFRPRKP